MDSEIKRIMSNIFEVQEDEINDDSSTDTIEKWDSLNHLNLILAIEEEFTICIDGGEMVQMASFAEIKRILREKMDGKTKQ